ncbi:EAL domain-containing protein [Solirubrobacter deserti]|uniref:EAL domain-containing protein n=1 Tax=Solirubrobacter deserti TaxID=2282478 RepID=A0ABT4RIY8_9ACTN|nr:EAL domain-containing protein [Solirubrobacter deserti]MDA0138455.1 EAL domain-containing protein [Solirubrobacter deserti]
MTKLAAETARVLAGARQDGHEGLSAVARMLATRFDGGCLVLFRSHLDSTLVPVAGHHDDAGIAGRMSEFLGAPSSFTSTRAVGLLGAGTTLLASGTPEHLGAWFGPHAGAVDLCSALAMPVRERDGAVRAAILLARHAQQAPFSRADREALEGEAAAIGEALEREWLAWELRRTEVAEARAARGLRLAEERFTAAFRHAPVGLALFSLGPGAALIVETNPHLAALLGVSEDELRRHSSPRDFVHADDLPALHEGMRRVRAGEVEAATVEARLRRADGELRLCEIALSLVRDGQGELRLGLCQAVDVTDARRDEARAERHVRCQRALAAIGRRAVEDATWEGLAAATLPALVDALRTDQACVLSAEPGGSLRVIAGEAAFALNHPLPDRPVAYSARELPVVWLARGVRTALVVPITPHTCRAPPTHTDDDPGSDLGSVEAPPHLLAAAAERRDAEAGARRRALLDPLTGLPTRTLFGDRIGHAVTRAARENTTLAVIRLDVNRFTDVNETFGHGLGDDLIRALAERLDGALRAPDSLARIGGDEFGVLCEHVGDERGALAVVQRLLRTFDAPIVLGDRRLHVSAGFGVAVGGGDASPEGLMRDADTAMRRAKERVGTGYELFDAAMRRRVVQRLQLEQDLRRALDGDELRLHYQPLVSLRERRIVGVEALVRWEHPERGMVSPADFVPVAEETGLIVPLGAWVLDEACRQLARWQDDSIYVSVNLSGRQLAVPGLADQVARTLERAGIAPERLALELTETVLMAETSSPAAILETLHALGVKLLLDDFGTGYSSLNYVKRFPLDGIKVDRSFVAGLPHDESDRAMLRAIASMASALDIAVLAEGVERLDQASWLAGVDCDVAQGFGLARPAPADVIGTLLRDGLPPERLEWTLVPEPDHDDEATMPLSEAAEALGVSTSTLRRWADTGRIGAHRTAAGHRRFPVSEVRRLLG